MSNIPNPTAVKKAVKTAKTDCGNTIGEHEAQWEHFVKCVYSDELYVSLTEEIAWVTKEPTKANVAELWMKVDRAPKGTKFVKRDANGVTVAPQKHTAKRQAKPALKNPCPKCGVRETGINPATKKPYPLCGKCHWEKKQIGVDPAAKKIAPKGSWLQNMEPAERSSALATRSEAKLRHERNRANRRDENRGRLMPKGKK